MKDKIRTCSRCGTRCDSWCPVCSIEFDKRRPASEMSVDERIAEFRSWFVTEIEFSKIHQRIEELVGRSVWTHELASTDTIIAEMRRGVPANMADVMNKVPAEKLITIGLEGSGAGEA